METFGDRLKFILSLKGITPYALSKKTPISEGTISRAINNKNTPTPSTVDSIVSALSTMDSIFSKTEIDWVSTGNGATPTLEKDFVEPQENQDGAEEIWVLEEEGVTYTANGIEFRKLSDDKYEITAPLVEEYARAGYLAGYKDQEFIEELPKHTFTTDRIHQGIYRSFRVKGDSMFDGSRDSIAEGDIVSGRRVHKDLWKSKLHIHEYPDFIIVHHDGVVVKRIVEHDVQKGILYCTSLNPNKELFPNTYYRLSEVYELYNIIDQSFKRKR